MKAFYAQHRNLVIILGLLTVVVIGFYFYETRDTSSSALLTSTTATTTSDDFLPVLLQLRKLKLDSSVFGGQVWLSLSDFSKPLSPVAPGRPNPFAPIGSAASSTAFSSSAR